MAAAPDLIIWPDSLNPRAVIRNYSVTDCEVVEGCALPGPRRYLIFNTETRNIGDADITLGNPAQNTNYVYALCHDHYHFRDFADYQLVNSAGQTVAIGLKAGFCHRCGACSAGVVDEVRLPGVSVSSGGWLVVELESAIS